MRILELQLIKFGQFSNKTFKFEKESPSFNIIHGLNEAGKTTTLRALIALLFGIPNNP